MNQTDRHPRTVVVGAGIIGTAIAYELQKRGHAVTLVDPNAPGSGASFGNMGSIAVTEFLPHSRPNLWLQTPGWLFNPRGPIRIPPRYAPQLAPWLWRFFRAGLPKRLREVESAGAALSSRALADTRSLLADIGRSDHLSQNGCLTIYADDAEFASDRDRLRMFDRRGIRHELLTEGDLHDLEPAIAPGVKRAVLLPDNRTLRDPFALVTRLAEAFVQRGGVVHRASVTGVDRGASITGVRLDTGEGLAADTVVLAAGAVTGRLAGMLDEPIPLETERGYHTQIRAPGLTLNHSIICPAKAFMVSPTGGGIRIGGTVEMAGLDAPPDWRRARITVKRARGILPGLRVEDTSEWMGHRPSMPDTVPVISASAKVPGVFYATGHGHLGMTHGATTAILMSDLITGAEPEIDMTPYRIDRF